MREGVELGLSTQETGSVTDVKEGVPELVVFELRLKS